ncbi:MAG: cupin domain-containing protein [Solirubrobacteraceae bacterium]
MSHRVLEDGTGVSGRFASFECQMPPGWPGPPQHIHREHDEAFLVLTGTVKFLSDGAEELAAPGTDGDHPRRRIPHLRQR